MRIRRSDHIVPLFSLGLPISIRDLGLCLCLLVQSAAFYPGFLAAQTGALRLFDEGSVLYQRDDFEGALQKYLQIAELGEVSAALYYNTANCYYKRGEIGRAILYYERALRLAPGDEDIQANLAIARQATVDKVSTPPQFAVYRWYQLALHLLSFETVLKGVGFLYVLFCLVLTIRIVIPKPALRRLASQALTMLGLCLSALILLGLIQWSDSRNKVGAIVIETEVSVRSSPEENAVTVFSVHEGTKVEVGVRAGQWIEIVLLDGKVGWIRQDVVEII